MPKSSFRSALALILLVLCGRPAAAQVYEDVGTRARGMSGAFVAVADDATATWWNPAGLAGGAYVSGILERGRVTEPRDLSPDAPARRATVSGLATAFPAAGISIYRLRISQITGTETTTGSTPATRQDPGGLAPVRSLSLSQYGLTIGQSIGNFLVIGTTLKALRGGVTAGLIDANADLLDAADDLPVERDWGADLDVGVMAKFGGAKLGLSVRNLTEPTFGEDEGLGMTVARQARAGASWTSKSSGGFSGLTLAGDFDLTTTTTILGDVQHLALGAETWFANRRFGLRAGFSNNLVEGGATSKSAGVSIGLTKSFSVDGAIASGSDRTLRGWSGSARFSY